MTNTIQTQTYFSPEDLEGCGDPRIREISENLNLKIGDAKYPCVGAKASFNSNQYRLGIYGEMGAEDTTQHLGEDLRKYIKDTIESESDYLTLIAVFTDEVESELDFETRLWHQVQKLHDSEKHEQKWDPAVSNNPADNNFSFSFDGTAFFIVGLHPKASRTARRIGYTAMAFNLHRQFDKLRENDQFENMKKVIRNREIAYDGTINPMLEDFGKGQEAPQYSGRRVEKEWKCPFQPGFVHQQK